MFSVSRKWCRWIVLLLAACTFSAVAADPAFAKPRKGLNDKLLEKDTSKSYALPYGLVILGVALGVMIVARPSTRADQVKRVINEDDEA